MVDVNHLEPTQRLATRLVTGIHHLPYEERLQQMSVHSQQWADLILSHSRYLQAYLMWPKRALLQGIQSSPEERIGLFGEDLEILEYVSGSPR